MSTTTIRNNKNFVLLNKLNLKCILMTIIIFQLFINEILCERLSGIYVDNGYDQTIVHRVITQREKREVEHEILNLLGLPERPKSLHSKVPQVKRSAPKFLIDIYKNALNEEENLANFYTTKKPDEFGLSGQDLRAIDQSDVIMTFAAHSNCNFIFFLYY